MDKAKVAAGAKETQERNIGSDSLCSTCNYIASCSFRNRSNNPVIYCEEFEASDAPQVRLLSAGKDTYEPEPIKVSPTGLCINCDNIVGCKYAKVNEGVWHCEEYS